VAIPLIDNYGNQEVRVMEGKLKIKGSWYNIIDWYPSKSEASKIASKHRKQGYYKSIRVVKKLADRRYARYYVCARR